MALASWGYCAFHKNSGKLTLIKDNEPLRYNHLYMAAPALASLCALAGRVAQEPPISTVDRILGGFESGLHDRGT
jgi:hypothetical protein